MSKNLDLSFATNIENMATVMAVSKKSEVLTFSLTFTAKSIQIRPFPSALNAPSCLEYLFQEIRKIHQAFVFVSKQLRYESEIFNTVVCKTIVTFNILLDK